jgi:hypothetical protein
MDQIFAFVANELQFVVINGGKDAFFIFRGA